MSDLANQFIHAIAARDMLQKKAIEKDPPSVEERRNLDRFLRFCLESRGKSIDEVAEAYLFLINMFKEETYFFIKNGKYRYKTFDEVNKKVYDNKEYMVKYMTGLAVSDYLIVPHLKMLRFFDCYIKDRKGKYLEIGPGTGQLLVKAIEKGKFSSYNACDLSESSVEICNAYLEFLGLVNSCCTEHKNIFDFEEKEKYDCIVMGEVLEHVEEPIELLKKICNLLDCNGTAFISTVINAPAIDHIYLFNNIREVLDLVSSAGFAIKDYICVTAGNVPLDKANKKKMAIDIAMILKKEEINNV